MAKGDLTAKQERFVELVLAGRNQTDAFRAAYDCTNYSDKALWVAACKMRATPKVALRLQAIQLRAAQKTELDRSWVIRKLMQNAEVCLADRTVKLILRKRGQPGQEGNNETETIEVHRHNPEAANKALELLGKEIGMFIERSEVGQPGEFSEMKDDALREAMVKEAESLGFNQVAKMIKSAMAVEGEVIDAETT